MSTEGLGTLGTLWIQSGLGTPGMLWGWALQDSLSGHTWLSRDRTFWILWGAGDGRGGDRAKRKSSACKNRTSPHRGWEKTCTSPQRDPPSPAESRGVERSEPGMERSAQHTKPFVGQAVRGRGSRLSPLPHLQQKVSHGSTFIPNLGLESSDPSVHKPTTSPS